MSNNGRIVVISKYSAAVGSFVTGLQSLLRPYSWSGIAMPLMHARDGSFANEDSGPYVIGLDAASKEVLISADVLLVDLDSNQLSFPSSVGDGILSTGAQRDKYRGYLESALGADRRECVSSRSSKVRLRVIDCSPFPPSPRVLRSHRPQDHLHKRQDATSQYRKRRIHETGFSRR